MSPSKTGVTGLKVLKLFVWVVYALATAASIIIAFGFVLLMFNANLEAGFAQFIYSWSLKFIGPFKEMIEPTKLANGGFISWSALVAVAAYAVLAALVGGVVNAISRRIYRDTHRPTVGQSTVSRTTQAEDGSTVTATTTQPIVAPSAVEQAEAEKAEAAAQVAAPTATPAESPEIDVAVPEPAGAPDEPTGAVAPSPPQQEPPTA